MVMVTIIVTVESMVSVVMLLKHGVRALHIGLETVGNLWKKVNHAIRKLFVYAASVEGKNGHLGRGGQLTDRFLVAAPMMGDSKSRNLSKLGSLVPIWERGHHTKFQLPSPLIGRARRGQSFDPFWTPPNYVLALAENFSWQIFFSLGGFQGPLRVSGWQKKNLDFY